MGSICEWRLLSNSRTPLYKTYYKSMSLQKRIVIIYNYSAKVLLFCEIYKFSVLFLAYIEIL